MEAPVELEDGPVRDAEGYMRVARRYIYVATRYIRVRNGITSPILITRCCTSHVPRLRLRERPATAGCTKTSHTTHTECVCAVAGHPVGVERP